jgi:ribosomal protein S11
MKKRDKIRIKSKGKQKKKVESSAIIKKKKIIQKKAHIFFKYGIAHLLFFKKHSNMFLILKTENKKHVVTITAGSCGVGKTKKQKISPYNIHLIIKQLKEYCNIYNINRVRFYLRSRLDKHYYNILKYLSLYNIRIIELNYVLHLAHNGMRGRKPRRI